MSIDDKFPHSAQFQITLNQLQMIEPIKRKYLRAPAAHERLSLEERKTVLQMLIEHRDQYDIAEKLGTSQSTISRHIAHMGGRDEYLKLKFPPVDQHSPDLFQEIPPKQLKTRRREPFSLKERLDIESLLKSGLSLTEICRQLKRPYSSIRAEVDANGFRDEYDGKKAHTAKSKRAWRRREALKDKAPETTGDLDQRVEALEEQVKILTEILKERV